MSDNAMTIQEAAHSLYEKYAHPCHPPWLVSVAIGADTIHVHVRSKRDLRLVSIPPEWEGYKVAVRVTGPMRLCAG
jgi:hypothetical protein